LGDESGREGNFNRSVSPDIHPTGTRGSVNNNLNFKASTEAPQFDATNGHSVGETNRDHLSKVRPHNSSVDILDVNQELADFGENNLRWSEELEMRKRV
jgi:hypothetical protein